MLLPELALGTLTGQDRAGALEHLNKCLDCRRELHSLTEVGDELLQLAPSSQPPVGFESRVTQRIGGTRQKSIHWRRRWIAAAAAALLGTIGGGAVVYLATSVDRGVADSYRDTLAIANGEYFAARPFVDAQGAEVGTAFGYQGSPSWVFFAVRAGSGGGVYDIEITAQNGRSWNAGEMEIEDGEGTWAQALPIDLHDVQQLRVIDRVGGETFLASWGPR